MDLLFHKGLTATEQACLRITVHEVSHRHAAVLFHFFAQGRTVSVMKGGASKYRVYTIWLVYVGLYARIKH